MAAHRERKKREGESEAVCVFVRIMFCQGKYDEGIYFLLREEATCLLSFNPQSNCLTVTPPGSTAQTLDSLDISGTLILK